MIMIMLPSVFVRPTAPTDIESQTTVITHPSRNPRRAVTVALEMNIRNNHDRQAATAQAPAGGYQPLPSRTSSMDSNATDMNSDSKAKEVDADDWPPTSVSSFRTHFLQFSWTTVTNHLPHVPATHRLPSWPSSVIPQLHPPSKARLQSIWASIKGSDDALLFILIATLLFGIWSIVCSIVGLLLLSLSSTPHSFEGHEDGVFMGSLVGAIAIGLSGSIFYGGLTMLLDRKSFQTGGRFCWINEALDSIPDRLLFMGFLSILGCGGLPLGTMLMGGTAGVGFSVSEAAWIAAVGEMVGWLPLWIIAIVLERS